MSESQSAKERRAKQTLNNLLLSLAATAGLVLILVLAVPRPNTSLLKAVDYKSSAQEAARSSSLPILAPSLMGKGWYSNSARWNSKTADGVSNWYVGFVGPKNQYLGLTQAFGSNQTWSLLQLKGNVPVGSVTMGGLKWIEWKATTVSNPPKTRDHAFVADIKVNDRLDQLLIYGTATESEFNRFAGLVAAAQRSSYKK
ncbi:MAG: hypothetical protein RIR34_954 [Actinomycetota bacterium]|jgi:hypothetical protein